MDKQTMQPSLLDRLKEHAASGSIPMHMPGHKRNTNLLGADLPYAIDITEIGGFDNLHGASGILKEYMEEIADFYGTKRSFYLVNGSTCGILAGIRAATGRGGKIVIARNSHKSVYHAIELFGLEAVYLVPEMEEAFGIHGAISVASIAGTLEEHPDAQLVVLTSPTYEGVVSDIAAIAEICHAHSIPLLVDEAHGSHFNYSQQFPDSAIVLGADLVIQSLHKTLPSLTMTSLAHLTGDLISPEELARQLAIFESSSPSYVLMASIDRCFRLLRDEGERLFEDYNQRLSVFSEKMKQLQHLKVLCHGNDSPVVHPSFFAFDQGKILISAQGTGLSGQGLAEILRSEHQLEMEMAYGDHALAMTSVCDTASAMTVLAAALLAVDRSLGSAAGEQASNDATLLFALPEKQCRIWQALESGKAACPLEQAVGQTAAEYIWAYPPGIPLLVPGERINSGFIRQIKSLLEKGTQVHSDAEGLPETIRIIRQKNLAH
ncbi:aminotransferase class I/II-fold pyridoxal phosphate-dependent enzyme [Trichococcus ilyis]|uniref:Arginine/lysine/ornithine decarboxylase n=1 Tax=Trichococcus ilyis TaxID=640938 RepID=A0A143YJ92_9LACT|nr:aminotransferase class I/II-fold pyridoxal phosphate-dependent enzyme [Trichococcus ilyis]CZQ92040.1 pyridoxal phosphate-dependent transferase [Trichococcus ilyis]SEI77424.1 Arginine/lysine/ornithine decarboxylase [Trichococcus ilyis]